MLTRDLIRAVRAEKHRTEQQLRRHVQTCLGCARQRRGLPGGAWCDIGTQLGDYIAVMERQEAMIHEPEPQTGWTQEELF